MPDPIDRSQLCFIILPGLAPDPLSVIPIGKYLESQGYAAIVTNFCGDNTTHEFSKVTIDGCLKNIGALIREAKKKHRIVVGIGISLGGALFIEHAKTHTDLDYIASIGTPFKLKWTRLISLGLIFIPIIHPIWKFFQPSQRRRPLPVEALPMTMDFFEGRFLKNLDTIKSPILFMHSKKDPTSDYRTLLEYAPKISNARTKILLSENGGHQMGYDPRHIVKNVFEFLGLPGNAEPRQQPSIKAKPSSVAPGKN